MNNIWSVYCHISPSGKFYIGITSQKLNRRWRNGSGYVSNKYFFRAIKKYGWDNFQHELIADNILFEEACNLEKLLIDKLNLTNPKYGYNIKNGGSDNDWSKDYRKQLGKKISDAWTDERRLAQSKRVSGRNNPLYGVDQSGENNPMYGKPSSRRKKVKCITTNKVFDAVRLAGKEYGISAGTISRACSGKQKYAGEIDGEKLYWKYVV